MRKSDHQNPLHSSLDLLRGTSATEMSISVLFLLLISTLMSGQVSKPMISTQGGKNFDSCQYDVNRDFVPDCVMAGKGGGLFVSPKILPELHFDASGLAAIFSGKHTWMYVNRRGKVLIADVPTFDNGPDPFHDGLVRVVTKGKYGFANRKGRIVIPAAYDGAMQFENGRAAVCKGCVDKCAGPDCEHRMFVGGKWSTIDVHGSVLSSARSRAATKSN